MCYAYGCGNDECPANRAHIRGNNHLAKGPEESTESKIKAALNDDLERVKSDKEKHVELTLAPAGARFPLRLAAF